MFSNGDGECNKIHLVILEQPCKVYRFRCEPALRPALGLVGERWEPMKKTFPEVELRNFNGKAVIRCSLFQSNIYKPSPHPNKLLVIKDGHDSQYVYVSPEIGYTARYERMKIAKTFQKDIVNVLYAKKKERFKFESKRDVLSQEEENQLKYEAEKEKETIKLNQARLCFEAFKIGEDNVWRRITEPVFSNIIYDYINRDRHNLEIYHLSTVCASAGGGDEVTILIDEVNTKGMKVRFFELNGDQEVWEAFGEYFDHYGYALVVRTPPYKNEDIDTNVKIFIELVSTFEGSIDRGQPVSFQYKP